MVGPLLLIARQKLPPDVALSKLWHPSSEPSFELGQVGEMLFASAERYGEAQRCRWEGKERACSSSTRSRYRKLSC